MKKKELQVESITSSYSSDISSHYLFNSDEYFYDSSFIDHLRLEKLRAQRTKSTLSIILLTLDKETNGEGTDMNEIFDLVRSKIRNIDITGFVNHKTIGILLPHTDENGAKELCEKLVNGNKKKELQVESITSSYSSDISSHYLFNSDEYFYDSSFIDHLRHEKLRAQRTKSTLSIILLTLDKETNGEGTDMNEIFDLVRSKIRNIDITGFVNHKTIGILLPHTDENGAKELCEKIVNGNKKPQFSVTTSAYPDQIFESLTKNGCIQSDAFPFHLYDSNSALWFKLLLKRGFDIVGSLAGILTLMPLMLITALAIKATSPGPVIFRQIRLGKQGAPFTFYKFRSMYINMGDQIHREYIQDFINGHCVKVNQGDTEKPLYKIKSDPRVTKVGRFIRKTSIDELPQFFNVLKGNMSLVGPRPPLPYEAEKYQAWHLRRVLEMKPGITGLWQVEGRSKTGWDDTVRLDIRYIQNWSLLLDLKIIFKTVKVVLQGIGAL